jgi:hypothetical protein
MSRSLRVNNLWSLVLCAVALHACGGSDETTLVGREPSPGAPDDGETPPPEEPPAEDGVITVMSRVCTPEGCNHYLYAMRELPADGKLERSQGIELGDTQGAVYDGELYVFDREDQSITRWTLDDTTTLRSGASISLQGTGVTQLDAISNVFVSAERAFALDSGAGVVVTWNPSAMEIVATTALPDAILRRDDAAFFGYWPIVANDRVYYAASWYDYESRSGYEKAALLSFASDQDQPRLETIEDERCGITSSVAPYADERGDVYFAGDWYIGLNLIGVPEAQRAPNPACLLRVSAGTGAVDPDYYVDLLEAADARAVTSAIYLGDDKWLANIWPRSVPAPSEAEIAADPELYFAAKSFEYIVIVDLESGTRIPVSGLERGQYGGLTPMFMDGVPYLQMFPENYAETGALLYEMKATGEARRVLEAGANGDFELIARLR